MWHREPDTLAPGLTWLPRLEALAEEGGSHGQLGGGCAVRSELPQRVLLQGSFAPWLPASESRTPLQGPFPGEEGGFITLLGLTKKSRDQSRISALRTNSKGVPLRGAPRGGLITVMRHILEVLGLCLSQENSLNIPVLPETSYSDHVAPI